jgi:hypothetical protein
MELVAILRALGRRLTLVGLGALMSIALGIVLAGGQASSRGMASTRVVLDTPKSQLLYAAPNGADTLWWRARVLADLMASQSLRKRIARDLGVQQRQLVVVDPQLTTPTIPASLPRHAAEAAMTIRQPYVLVVRFDQELPIISIEASAPDRRRATRLVEAATRALGAATSAHETRRLQGIVVDRVAPVRAEEVVRGPGRKLLFGVPVILFGFWCGCVAIVPAAVRSRRARRRRPPSEEDFDGRRMTQERRRARGQPVGAGLE